MKSFVAEVKLGGEGLACNGCGSLPFDGVLEVGLADSAVVEEYG